MMNLDVTENQLKQIDKFNFVFIWDSSASKIKRDVMIQDYHHGGLKAPCIFTMDKIYKIKMLCRIISSPGAKWNAFIEHKLSKYGGLEYLMNCNFDWKSVTKNAKLDDFYVKALRAWNEVTPANGNRVIHSYQLLKQKFNNNQRIKMNGKEVFIRELKTQSCDDFAAWTEQGKFLPFQSLVEKFQLRQVNVMQYNQIIHAVPKFWKQILNELATGTENPDNSRATERDQSDETLKKLLIRKRSDEPAAEKHWIELIGEDNFPPFWKTNCKLLDKISPETKLRVFQFKILHRIIATREWLHKYKIVDSPNCIFCARPIKDTVEHFLFQCNNIHVFWRQAVDIFKEHEGIQMEITIENCLFLRW
jgi:hypothetical protein